jgi:hypothetical protein
MVISSYFRSRRILVVDLVGVDSAPAFLRFDACGAGLTGGADSWTLIWGRRSLSDTITGTIPVSVKKCLCLSTSENPPKYRYWEPPVRRHLAVMFSRQSLIILLTRVLTGKRFELSVPTLALDTVDGKRVAVTIPGGDIIKVVSGPRHGDRMVDVLWEGRVVVMFESDVSVRGTEITDKSVGA